MNMVKIGFIFCLAIDVLLYCSVRYKLRQGTARVGGLSTVMGFSAVAALWTLSYLLHTTILKWQMYPTFGFTVGLIVAYFDLSREDRKVLAEQGKSELGYVESDEKPLQDI